MSLDVLGDTVDHLEAIGELVGDLRLRLGLLHKDEDRKKGDSFLRRVV